MADSLLEQITANIATTVASVTVDNGYDIDIQDTKRIPQSSFSVQQYPTVMIVLLGEDKEEGVPARKTSCIAHYQLLFWNSEWTDPSKVAIVISTNIERALSVDLTRGNIAYDTDVIKTEYYLGDEAMPLGGGSIFVDVMYRHSLGNPFLA